MIMLSKAILAASFFLIAANAANADNVADQDVCHYIAANQPDRWHSPAKGFTPNNAFLRDYFVRYGWFDLDGDGISEHVGQLIVPTTFSGDQYDYHLSAANSAPSQKKAKPLSGEAEKVLDDNRETYGEAFLPFKGRFYDVDFADREGAFAVDAKYYGPGGVTNFACVFQNGVKVASFSAGDTSLEFKDDARVVLELSGDKLDASKVLATSRLSGKSPGSRYRLALPGGGAAPACAGSSENDECKDVWKADFDNDGVPDQLLQINGSSGSGRGCEFSYFLLLTPDGRIARGAKQNLLLKLQSFQASERFPIQPCGIQFRWVSVAGRTILERKAAELPRITSDLIDELWIVRNGKVSELASAGFRIERRIVHSDPPR